jgi:hypothetical protein
MLRLAAMRGAGERQFLIAEAVARGRARFHKLQRLDRLDRRTREHRVLDIAEREREASASITHGNRAAMPAFDQGAAQHLDENGIAHLWGLLLFGIIWITHC